MTHASHRGSVARPLPGWVLVLAVWITMLAIMGVHRPFTGGEWPAVTGDDAMRMVEVEDLVNGQAWTDTTQYRDNTPFGAPMHWSRLVDVPLAALVLVLRPAFGADAIYAAAALWPPVLLLPFLFLVLALAGRLGGATARGATAFVLITAPMVHAEFAPGRVDHHNVQMVLILGLMLATLLGRESRIAAVVAGLLAATCIAIGTECLPAVLAALVFFPLFWVLDGPPAARNAIAFGLAFGAGLLVHLLLVTDLAALWRPACDALSVTYVWAGIAYAATVAGAVLAGRSLTRPLPRLGLVAVAAIVTLASTAILFPACLGGPYAELDADLAGVLLTDFGEALPVWRWFNREEGGVSTLIVLPFVGVAAALVMGWRAKERRLDWIVLAGFAVVLFVVMLAQVRGVRLAQLPAIVACGCMIGALWQRVRERIDFLRFATLVLGIVASAGALHLIAAYLAFPQGTSPRWAQGLEECLLPPAYERLAALPEGRVISYVIIGPQILLRTPHAIVTAGYHRNEQGLRDLIRFAGGGEAEARSVARERDLDYLAFCKDVPLGNGLHGVPAFTGTDEGSWDWLTPISAPDETLQIYAIDIG